MVSNGIGSAIVGGGGQYQRPSVFVFFSNVGEEGPVVGEGGGIERDALHDLVFEPGLSFGDPAGDAKETGRTPAEQEKERLM